MYNFCTMFLEWLVSQMNFKKFSDVKISFFELINFVQSCWPKSILPKIGIYYIMPNCWQYFFRSTTLNQVDFPKTAHFDVSFQFMTAFHTPSTNWLFWYYRANFIFAWQQKHCCQAKMLGYCLKQHTTTSIWKSPFQRIFLRL